MSDLVDVAAQRNGVDPLLLVLHTGVHAGTVNPSPVEVEAAAQCLKAGGCEPVAASDDPAPTTGGPYDYGFPSGCRCYIREDADWGEVLTRPPEGCPVHSCTCLSPDGVHAPLCVNTRLNAIAGIAEALDIPAELLAAGDSGTVNHWSAATAGRPLSLNRNRRAAWEAAVTVNPHPHLQPGGKLVCSCGGLDNVHAVDCYGVAIAQPHTMVSPDWTIYYPADQADADRIAAEHHAAPLRADFPYDYVAPPE